MRKRRILLGLLILAGVVGLAFVALRQRPAPSRSVPRRSPGATGAEMPAEAAANAGAEIAAEGTLWGTVTVPDGIDVTKVRLSIFTKLGIYRSSNTGITNFRASIDVDREGTFRRDGLPLGEYQLLARHPGCAACRMQFELRPGRGTGPLHVGLGNPGSLLVRIVGPNGRGLSGELVALHRGEGTPEHIEYRLEPARPQVGEGSTDADGEVRFADLESGTYTLTRRGTVVEQRSAEVRPGEETVVLFDARASLFGRLLGHDGQPIPGARLFLRASGGRIYETRTDDGGALAIRGIAAGEYGVTASVKTLGTAAIPLAETVVIEGGRTDERDLRLPAIRLTGLVVEAQSGAPFTSRRVSVHATAAGLDSVASARTSADGRFELAGLYPGRYSMSADPENADDRYDQYASEVVTLTPTPATQELTIRMPPGVARDACLHVTVRDRQGNPAENLFFAVDLRMRVASKKGILHSSDAKVVGPGIYEISLTPGAHHIRVSTQLWPTGAQPCYWNELTIDVASGQTIEKDIVLDRLLE